MPEIVKKPWGWESIVYESRDMRVWLLHIKPGHATSLHYHNNKHSRLCVLQGNARLRAYNGDAYCSCPTVDMANGIIYDIEKKRPHQTISVAVDGEPASADGVLMLESVSPPDKDDLVRIEDGYGRDSQYERDVISSAANSINITVDWTTFLQYNIRVKDGVLEVEKTDRMRVSDYIFRFLADKGITHVFGVVGGGAMHLSDSVGNTDGITFVACHHEQAAAMAAESYAHYTGKPGVVMVTSGPGGTNAITGVAGAWIDSVPMIIISGQVTRDTMGAGKNGIRQLGIQESAICDIVVSITSDCHMLMDAAVAPTVMEQAWRKATTGRQGPVWIDVPLDVQGQMVGIGRDDGILHRMRN